MVTVGFVVEGPSDKKLVESELFQSWLRDDCGLAVVSPIADAGGNDKMCSPKITAFVQMLRRKRRTPIRWSCWRTWTLIAVHPAFQSEKR